MVHIGFSEMEKYLVNKEIGRGAFGKVFVIESKSTGIQYVVKQIDLTKLSARQKTLAEKEIQVLAKLKHPHIVRYKEAYSDEKHLHIVMELCELGDLHQRVQEARNRNDRLLDSQVMDYFVQICLALQYIHQQRILHRDLKTKNIFLKKGNFVKLGDFGVAKVLENSFELARTCIGSPFYISPEMCENEPYDKKSDIWALGCVLFELATLKYAFTAKNMKLLLTKISAGDHTPLPPNTNPKIRHLIKKLLNPNPKQRPTVTEIFMIPYVTEFKDKISCRSRISKPHIRSRSGEDLRSKIVTANNFRCKSSRIELPISKSSLNLNCNDITEPEAKYKSTNIKPQLKKPNFWKFCNSPKPEKLVNEENDGGNINKSNFTKDSKGDGAKAKKLPKSDSLYYTLIAQNNREKMSIFHNIFDKAYHNFTNQAEEEGITSTDYAKESQGEHEKGENASNESLKQSEQNNILDFAFSISTSSQDATKVDTPRRRWTTTKADQNQLVSFLHESDLVSTFTADISDLTIVYKEITKSTEKSSIDDLLFTETTDLSHIAVLKPKPAAAAPINNNIESPKLDFQPQFQFQQLWDFKQPNIFENQQHKDTNMDRALFEPQPINSDTVSRPLFQTIQDNNAQPNTENQINASNKLQCYDALRMEEQIQDETYIVSKGSDELKAETMYQDLEQRRIDMEQAIGLTHFMSLYKTLENELYSNLDNGDTLSPFRRTRLQEIAMELGIELSCVHLVWQLVLDDAIYKSQK